MAYPIFPATYQPYNNYYQPLNLQPQQQTIQNQNSIIWVSGLAEAQSYPVAPNCAVALWEQSGKIIFLKSADATGKPSLRIYDLVERTEALQIKQESQEYKYTDFALKRDLDTIAAATEALKDEMSEIRREMKKGAAKDDA